MKSYSVTIQMKAVQQYYHVVLFNFELFLSWTFIKFVIWYFGILWNFFLLEFQIWEWTDSAVLGTFLSSMAYDNSWSVG